MNIKKTWSEFRMVKKEVAGLIPLMALFQFIALSFIWLYLYRLGRQDVFSRILSFKVLISSFAVSALLSLMAFFFTFFIQSLIMTLIVRRTTSHFSGYEKLKVRYVFVQFICSLCAVGTLFLLSWFTDVYKEHPGTPWTLYQIAGTGVLSAAFCFILNRKILAPRAALMDSRGRQLFMAKFAYGIPFMLGIIAWLFIFPLQMFIRDMDFTGQGAGVWPLVKFTGQMVIMVALSLFPGALYILLPADVSLFRRLATVSGGALASLILSFCVFSVLPVKMINMAMNFSGVVDLNTVTYAIPVERYPEEMFSAKVWHSAAGRDGKFTLIRGVKLFSMGSVNLLCPQTVVRPFRDSLKFRPGDAQFDNRLRGVLDQSAATCVVIEMEALPSW